MGDPSRVRLCLRKRTIELIAAAHNDLFVGNVSFAIRKRTFAATNLNDRFGSTPALRGCHTIDRFCDAGEGQLSANIGRSLGPIAMAAFGSESSRWTNMHNTSAVDPEPKSTEFGPDGEITNSAVYCSRLYRPKWRRPKRRRPRAATVGMSGRDLPRRRRGRREPAPQTASRCAASVRVSGSVTNEIAVWMVTMAAIAGALPPICLAKL